MFVKWRSTTASGFRQAHHDGERRLTTAQAWGDLLRGVPEALASASVDAGDGGRCRVEHLSGVLP
jgi:hypothetical protein